MSGTVRPNPAKPRCVCGGVWFAKGKCRRCYWRDYNAAHPERQVDYNHSLRKGRKRRLVLPSTEAPRQRKARPRKKKPDGWFRRSMEQQGRCGNRWCQRLREQRVENDGTVVLLPCEWCSRIARGLCYACNKPLDPAKDVHHYRHGVKRSRWHMDARNGCYMQRIRDRRLQRRRERWHEDEAFRQRDLRRRRAQKAKARCEVLPFKRKREQARRALEGKPPRARSPLKWVPCPEGCGRVMSYRTKPAVRCDACWERVARELEGGDA